MDTKLDNSTQKVKILSVDDKIQNLNMMNLSLTRLGFEVYDADSVAKAIDILETVEIDVVATDLKMPGQDGIDLLRWVVAHQPAVQVIIITGYGTVETVVEALKLGAISYVERPIVDYDKFYNLIDIAVDKRALMLDNIKLREKLNEYNKYDDIIGSSAVIRKVYNKISLYAPKDVNLIITGESGTGKELVARAIHNRSKRRNNVFHAVNCATITDSLADSSWFGHKKGAFTGATNDNVGIFAAANGGTLFLDEVSELSAENQARLLRVVQMQSYMPVGETKEKRVDFRLIVATNCDLKEEVAKGKFREDLYFRLAVAFIHTPTLRERREDIPLLIHHFLKIFAKRHAVKVDRITPEAMSVLCQLEWKGNVRDLSNAIERLVITSNGEMIEVEDVMCDDLLNVSQTVLPKPTVSTDHFYRDANMTIAELEKRHILRVLDENNWHKSKSADILGIAVRTLRNKLKEYKVDVADSDDTE